MYEAKLTCETCHEWTGFVGHEDSQNKDGFIKDLKKALEKFSEQHDQAISIEARYQVRK